MSLVITRIWQFVSYLWEPGHHNSHEYYIGEDEKEFDSFVKTLKNIENLDEIFESDEYWKALDIWKAQKQKTPTSEKKVLDDVEMGSAKEEDDFKKSFLKLLTIFEYSHLNSWVKTLTLECFNYLKNQQSIQLDDNCPDGCGSNHKPLTSYELNQYIWCYKASLQKNETIKNFASKNNSKNLCPWGYFPNMLDAIAIEYAKNNRNKSFVRRCLEYVSPMIKACLMKLDCRFFKWFDKENLLNPELAEFRKKYLTELLKIVKWCFLDKLIARISNQRSGIFTIFNFENCKLNSNDIKVLRAICSLEAHEYIYHLKFSNVKFIDEDTWLAELNSQYFARIYELALKKCQLKTIPDMGNLFSNRLDYLDLDDNEIEDLNLETNNYKNGDRLNPILTIDLRGNPLKTVSGCGLNRLNPVKFILNSPEKCDQGFKDELKIKWNELKSKGNTNVLFRYYHNNNPYDHEKEFFQESGDDQGVHLNLSSTPVN